MRHDSITDPNGPPTQAGLPTMRESNSNGFTAEPIAYPPPNPSERSGLIIVQYEDGNVRSMKEAEKSASDIRNNTNYNAIISPKSLEFVTAGADVTLSAPKAMPDIRKDVEDAKKRVTEEADSKSSPQKSGLVLMCADGKRRFLSAPNKYIARLELESCKRHFPMWFDGNYDATFMECGLERAKDGVVTVEDGHQPPELFGYPIVESEDESLKLKKGDINFCEQSPPVTVTDGNAGTWHDSSDSSKFVYDSPTIMPIPHKPTYFIRESELGLPDGVKFVGQFDGLHCTLTFCSGAWSRTSAISQFISPLADIPADDREALMRFKETWIREWAKGTTPIQKANPLLVEHRVGMVDEPHKVGE